MTAKPILWIVIPCYNEQEVLPITAPQFLQKVQDLAAAGLVSGKSRICFVNDGSRDATWQLICQFARQDEHYIGISQSRNRGHQAAVLAGLMEARDNGADVTISIDCDGQDDINAMDEMVRKYLAGAEVVYGVRSRRDTDTFFKRFTAEGFYKILQAMGVEIVFNHADYRLMSRRALQGLSSYREVNLFLRGIVPQIGYKSSPVTHARAERFAGESKYPLRKMLALAWDGITSFSVKPIGLLLFFGILLSIGAAAAGIICLIVHLVTGALTGTAAVLVSIWLACGLILTALGLVGEYIGKIYGEVKDRPRYIIEAVTLDPGKAAETEEA